MNINSQDITDTATDATLARFLKFCPAREYLLLNKKQVNILVIFVDDAYLVE